MSGNWWFSSVKNWQQIKMLNVGHFYTIFHSFFCRPLLKKSPFFMVYDEKNCCFSTFAQYNPQSGQTKKVSLISERAEKSWGGEGHSALEKPVWRRQIYSYMYLGMHISKQGMWNGCHLWIYGRSTFSGKNKTVRGWTSGRSLPVWKFVKYPPEVTTIRLNPSINSNFFNTV